MFQFLLGYIKNLWIFLINYILIYIKLIYRTVTGDVATAISLEPAMKFNGGGHINHSIFWTNLSPQGGGLPKGTVNSRR